MDVQVPVWRRFLGRIRAGPSLLPRRWEFRAVLLLRIFVVEVRSTSLSTRCVSWSTIAHCIVQEVVINQIIKGFFVVEGILCLGLHCLVDLILIEPAIAAAVKIGPQWCFGTRVVCGFHHEECIVSGKAASVSFIAVEIKFKGISIYIKSSGFNKFDLLDGAVDS